MTTGHGPSTRSRAKLLINAHSAQIQTSAIAKILVRPSPDAPASPGESARAAKAANSARMPERRLPARTSVVLLLSPLNSRNFSDNYNTGTLPARGRGWEGRTRRKDWLVLLRRAAASNQTESFAGPVWIFESR